MTHHTITRLLKSLREPGTEMAAIVGHEDHDVASNYPKSKQFLKRVFHGSVDGMPRPSFTELGLTIC